jgi:hypothetical protein
VARPSDERAPALRDVGTCVALRRGVAGRLPTRESHAVCGRRRGPGRRRRERAGWIERHWTVRRTTHVKVAPLPFALAPPSRACASACVCPAFAGPLRHMSHGSANGRPGRRGRATRGVPCERCQNETCGSLQVRPVCTRKAMRW